MEAKCKECKKILELTPGRRKKEFCNSTCRSNYWQKKKRKEVPKELEKWIDKNFKPVIPEKEEVAPEVETVKKENSKPLSKSEQLKQLRVNKNK